MPISLRLFGVVEVLEREHGAAFEIVPQAERVADFVHGHHLQTLRDELFLIGLGYGAGRAGGQNGRAERELHRLAVGQGTMVEQVVAVAQLLCWYDFKSSGPPVRAAMPMRRECFVLGFPELQKIGVEDDRGIENLPGQAG